MSRITILSSPFRGFIRRFTVLGNIQNLVRLNDVDGVLKHGFSLVYL